MDFVGFKDGASTYKVLATGTVHGDTAFGTWQPTAADNGTYHVTALLSHPMFGPAWPYSWSSKTDPPKVSTTDVVVAIDPEGANPGDVEPGDPGPVDFVLVDGSPRIYHNHHLDFWTTPLFSSTRIEARGTSLSARNEIDIDIPTGVAYFPSNKAIAGLSMLGSYDPQTGRMSGTYYWEAAWQVSFLSGHEWDKGTFWAVVFSSPSDTLPTGVTVHFDGQYCLDRTGQLEFSFPGHPYWDDTISTDVVDSHFTVHFTAKEAP
ncbi:MAG: hypothetical protein JXA87_15825 [Thermoleophilia bacterium]|nr:hypothetical protein [Thermoleophilia bacterium]